MLSKLQARKSKGSAMADFAPALVVFLAVFIPTIHFGVFPIRLMLAHTIFESLTHDLSLLRKRSSIDSAFNNSWQKRFLTKCGIGLRATSFSLTTQSTVNNRSADFQAHKDLPADWLPGGLNYPCIYKLTARSTFVIYPVLGADKSTGLLQPVEIETSAAAIWENQEFDSQTGKLYLNE